ncbi:hypothetical protein I5L51_04785 [Pseudomonas mendocina]|nr:hypothetical protein [Pseudomonas mendocina]MBH3338423.1 hypothetical protein [Pseudomonas mendocina]
MDEDEKIETDKRKFLYDYSRNIYIDEFARSKSLEDKAARYFGFLSILIGIVTAHVRFSEHKLLGLDGVWDWIYLILILLAYLAMANCGRCLFDVLRPRAYSLVNMNVELRDYFYGKKLADIYESVIDDLVTTAELAREVNNQKVDSIKMAHKELAASLIFVSLLFAVFIFL